MHAQEQHPRYCVAFDTANEVISLAVGLLGEVESPELAAGAGKPAAGKGGSEACVQTAARQASDVHAGEAVRSVALVASRQLPAHRASNTQLLPALDALLSECGVARENIACVVCGRGPGSFTGVRICVATAKGVASALEVPLIGVSTLDALAWELQASGVRGEVLVVADAMRREVYPQRFVLTDSDIGRTGADTVAPVASFDVGGTGFCVGGSCALVAGDALAKYAEVFAPYGPLAREDQWRVQGPGLLCALAHAWQAGECDPCDAHRHDPAVVLPVYTRLSDAEENERARKEASEPRDLRTGVQSGNSAGQRIRFAPMRLPHTSQVAELEAACMGSDAWNTALFADELPRKDRTWWVALDATGAVVGYAGGQVVDGQLQLFKVAVEPRMRRQRVARELVEHVCDDARNLGAERLSLEVRASNKGAVAFYRSLGLESEGVRPGYYSDGEDACIMSGPLPCSLKDVAGMDVRVGRQAEVGHPSARPLILAIETSCDETAAAVIDGSGAIVADAIASQIDFHARFGGVVPEIASRKHIEAICGVSDVCLEQAGCALAGTCGDDESAEGGLPGKGRLPGAVARVRFRDLDAVAVTYAPGLVGALVVGMAYSKGIAWGADIPLVVVNHLEGHLYANKLSTPDLQPPAVVSLVSGGHTMLVLVRDWGDYRVLGSTIDDAVGEAFDKVAKALGLGYPGGPVISKLAQRGNPAAIDFPRAMLHSGDLRFSLSGLKTAVITYINKQRAAGENLNLGDIAASFQAAVVDVQVAKACTALDETGAREFCLGGGVAANPALRGAYERACEERGVRLTMPPLSACTDNASMIALVALDRYEQGKFASLDADVAAHTSLEDPY